MKEYQTRVVNELKELTEKREKLGLFIDRNPIFETLPEAEQFRLRSQFDIMIQYEAILKDRIENFK